jgi:3-oxoadipate enol-lactonase
MCASNAFELQRRIHVRKKKVLEKDKSTGPSMMFVHGGGGSRMCWMNQIGHFRSLANRVFALDLPGHGLPPRDPTIGGLARYTSKVQQTHGLTPSILTGHSVGARAVLKMYKNDPSCAAGLVLVDCGVLARNASECRKLQGLVRSVGGKKLLEQVYPDMFPPGTSSWLIRSYLSQVHRLDEGFIERLILDTIAFDAHEMARILKTVRVPLLVVQSTDADEQGRRHPVRHGDDSVFIDWAKTYAPNCAFSVIRSAGHFPHVTRPAAFNHAVGAFVQGRPVPALL